MTATDSKYAYEICPPRADAMIYSLRAFGYDLAMSIADLIDNSIYASAKNIYINYSWNDGEPWIRIMDDGDGMSCTRLKEAMRLGSQSPLEERHPDDLGRFGLGLKTASFSQCQLLTVQSKELNAETTTRCWDLDHVRETKEWELRTIPPDYALSHLEPLNKMAHGTIVLWQKLDKVIGHVTGDNPETIFYEKFLNVKKYLEMVFHRYLSGSSSSILIKVGEADCEPWDPFLLSNHFSQELSSERYKDGRISVIPYVLPHVSKRTPEEHEIGSGTKGWNAHQGFYVYRNKRMIVSGGYLDFDLKAEEHYKLARIMVDITNDMDHEWNIDVRKAVAQPPDRLRNEMLRIAKATRNKAVQVYRARTGRVRRTERRPSTIDIWIRRKKGEKIYYHINPNNLVIKRLIEEVNPGKSWVNKLFHVIESTVPHRLIIIDNAETEDCHVDLPVDQNMPPEALMELCIEFYNKSISEGRSHSESVDYVTSIEPFDSHPAYRANLDELIGENQ